MSHLVSGRYCLCSLLVLWFILPLSLAAQVVETDPIVPIEDEGVTVYFNADEGTGDLAGYDGDIYAHTGVITNESTDDSDWRYVKTEWPENRDDIRLEHVHDDRYRLEIDNIRDYYSNNDTGAGAIPDDETVERMAFVFRNADGSIEGKAEGGEDIFVDVERATDEPFVSVRLYQPTVSNIDPILAEQDTTIQVIAVARANETELSSLYLTVNGTEVARADSDSLSYELSLEGAGRADVEAVAEGSGGEEDRASFYAVRIGETVEAERPPGVEDGINYHDDDSRVTLSFFAPYKEHAFVIGDFTDWEVHPEHQMNRHEVHEDSVHYWLEVDGLSPGTEYGFQYLVDGDIRIGDPYAEKVLSPNDHEISSTTYPNLKPFPEGKTRDIVAVLETGREDYDWQVTDFTRPDPEDLVIYELLIRDFLEEGNFQTLTDTLDYLDNLGVNAIELMPVSNFDGNDSWGYNPNFHFALDKSYGTQEAFKQFVDEAHSRGIAIIMDVVYNHATGQSPFVRLYNEGDYGAPTAENPWMNEEAPHPMSVFNAFDQEVEAVHYFIDRANRYWLEKYNVDGFRFDLSKGFTQNHTATVEEWSAYDPDRVRLLTRMADQIWSTDEDAIIILEHFAENSEEQELAAHGKDRGKDGMLLWQNLNRPYNQAAMGYTDADDFSSDFSTTYAPERNMPAENLISYMESHDEQWMMYRNLAFGPEEDSYDVTELPTALNRQKLAGAFFFTVPGPRMMWQFGELGYGYGDEGEQCLRPGDGSLGECTDIAPGRTAPKPIRWDYRIAEDREMLYETWSALINLRNDHDVFTSLETDVDLQVGQGSTQREIRLSHEEMDVAIVGNFGLDTLETTASLQQDGTWYDVFEGGKAIEVEGDAIDLTLPPGYFHLLTSEEVDFPPEGLLKGAENGPIEPPEAVSFQLLGNYPNPAQDETTIPFVLDEDGFVTLDLFDALGRKIDMIIDNQHYESDHHELSYDVSRLPSGIYFLRLEMGGRSDTDQMTIVR